MRYPPRQVGLAVLPFVLGCGALAESSHHGPVADPSESEDASEAPPTSESPSSPEAGIWDEQPRVSSCPGGVVPNTLEISNQGQIDALVGCERIEGALLLHLFEGIDETPLLSLKDVDGSLTVVGQQPILDPLIGFSALEEVTDLLLDGLTLRDLHPLTNLRRIGTETSSTSRLPAPLREQGGLEIRNSSGFTSLAGLDSLEAAHWIVLENNPELVSLRGAPRLRSVSKVSSAACPLSDLGGLEQFGVEDLGISDSALVDLRGLGDASALKRLSLYDNAALLSLKGGQFPARMENLDLSSNRSLTDLAGLEGLRSAHSIQIYSSEDKPGPRSLHGLDGLTQVDELLLRQTTIENLSGLGALEHVDTLQLDFNAFLTSLDGLSGLQSIGSLELAESPAFASFRGLGAATVVSLSVSDARQLSLGGLESATISQSLTISGVAQLSASAGPPGVGRDTLLEINLSPELRDLQAFAGITALRGLRLAGTGIENLDPLGSLVELLSLDLDDNARLQQIDALSGVTGLTSLSVTGNSALQRLPTFSALTDACDSCGFELLLEGNPALRSGPGLPGIELGSSVRIANNPALTSLAGLDALRALESLQVERNPVLVELALPALSSASVIVVHGNAAFDDTQLNALRSLPRTAVVKIASNSSGASRLDPCPWPADGVCDEELGDCAVGSDEADCRLLTP